MALREEELEQIGGYVVTHMTRGPEVEEHARKQGIALYYSYDF